MEIKKKDFYTYIIFTDNFSQNDLIGKIDLIINHMDNLIIDIQVENINKEQLVLSLLKYSSLWKKKNKSFILVVNDSKIDYDKEIVCLPTLDEAIEYLYMEELERNV